MAALPAIEIRLDVGTVEPAWCDTCMQMSAVTASVAVIGPLGVAHVGDLARCFQCNPEEQA